MQPPPSPRRAAPTSRRPRRGAHVAAPSRRADRASLLREVGADQVIVDTGSITAQVREVCTGGVDKVLELVGTATLEDSLRCAMVSGIVCMTGMVGDRWSLPGFSPMDAIPSAVCLTTYDGRVADFMRTPLRELVDQVATGHAPCAGRADVPAPRDCRGASLHGGEPGRREDRGPALTFAVVDALTAWLRRNSWLPARRLR